MLGRLFPTVYDNNYRGSWIAVWLLVPVLLWKLAIGVHISGMNPLIDNRFVMQEADGMPLGTADPEAASWIVYLASSWGFLSVLLCLLAILALVRYRAMLPLAILLLAADQIGRKIIVTVQPIIHPTADEQNFGALLNWGFTIALVLSFALSLVKRGRGARS